MPQESCIQSDNRIKSKLGENMTTVQGWTLSITDATRMPILTNLFADTINVEYDSEWLDRNGNGPRYGTIQMELIIPEEQITEWNNYTQIIFHGTETRTASLTIEAGNNIVTYENAVLTSMSWIYDYSDDRRIEINYHFTGSVNVVALPPREFRKKFKPQNLEWKIYGF